MVIKQRDTKQRRLVYEAVMQLSSSHPTADDVYRMVHAIDSKISKATVYRNLKILSNNENISHVKVPSSDRFDNRLDNHCHIICTSCNKVIDAPLDYVADFDQEAEKLTGYKIKRHRTVFEGICCECQKKDFYS